MDVRIGRLSEGVFRPDAIRQMHELRYSVFRERLQWQVDHEEGREIDLYDTLDPTYMLVTDDATKVRGCWRLLPTTGPYMLKDTFPQLLCGRPAPNDAAVWELSRFALGRHDARQGGFCDTALMMMEHLLVFGLQCGIERFVTVTTVAIERLLRGAGVPMTRHGVPVQVGIERTIVLHIDVNLHVLSIVRGRRHALEPVDRVAA